MIVQFQVRRDTAANFAAANPVLLEGEWALETDTDKVKMGDGSATWNTLPYFLDGKPSIFLQTTQPTMAPGDLWLDVTDQI